MGYLLGWGAFFSCMVLWFQLLKLNGITSIFQGSMAISSYLLWLRNKLGWAS